MGKFAGGVFCALLLAAVIVAGHQFAAPLRAEPEEGAAAPGKERSALLWQRIKGLSGEWDGASTRGWTQRLTYRVIAAESAVVETSFDAHPNGTMVTMYH